MITAVIVLAVVALALGGYIAFDIFHGNRDIRDKAAASAANPPTAADIAEPKAEEKHAVEQPAPQAEERPSAQNASETSADKNEQAQLAAAEPQTVDDAMPEQVTDDEPQTATAEDKPTVEEKPISEAAPNASEATDKPQTEKKARRSRYKDPDIVFTEEVEKGRSKIAQKQKLKAEEQTAEQDAPVEKKKPNRPVATKKSTKPTVDKKAAVKDELKSVEQKAVEPKAVEPKAVEPQAPAKEEKNKIAQNISGEPEVVAETQRGDEAAETKQGAKSKVLPPDEVRDAVAATEVDKIMTDEVAESLIEKSEGKTDKTKQGIINIDTLGQYFDSGDVVTLDEIKKRIKGFNKKTTYIKVLARGTLSKALTVEADSFSLQAVKMIVLTGGKVIKKQ